AVHNQLPNPPSVILQASIHGSTSGLGQCKRTHENTQAELAAAKKPSLKKCYTTTNSSSWVQVNKRNMSMVPKVDSPELSHAYGDKSISKSVLRKVAQIRKRDDTVATDHVDV
nr:NADH-ubiquinone reductase complex 1 MLRQ subunit [Tanacetum cinerariifolium]